MRDHIKPYMERLEKGICEYMDAPVSERSAEAVKHMIHAWMAASKLKKRMYTDKGWDDFTREDAEAWAAGMVNEDGTYGAHWTIEQTTAVAEANGVMFDHIADWHWWITMNMMYSDYCRAATKNGVGTPAFFADMAKAFLFDDDGPGPEAKLGAYYHGIVCTHNREE